VPGTPARERLLAGDEALAARVADAAAALHAAPVRLERAHALADELRVLRERVDALDEHRGRARTCLVRVERAAAEPWAWRSLPVHRDLYHDQVLVDGPSVALVDLDDAAVSEPAVDVANFLAHLRLLALEEPLRREAVARAAGAFRARSHELDPLLDARLVRLLEAATLLRLATIHVELKQRLLRECEALLPPLPPRAPRVRQGSRVAGALDGGLILGLVADAVEARTGARPTECRARLLRRHKGRATVRYALETAHGRVDLVGKWFRGERSARVAEVHAALRAAGVAVPEVVVHVPELRVLFFTAADGPTLRDVLDDQPEQAARAGAWLARFHGCGAQLPARRQPPGPRTRGEPFASLAEEVASALQALAPRPALPTHWDFATVEVLVPPRGPTVVTDFDDAGLDDPAMDVANFEATLQLRALRRFGDARAYDSAIRAFRRGYEEERALPSVAPPLEAFVWLRLARRNHRSAPDGIVWRHALARAEAVLHEAVPA
jgi:thiamine kinase-like enzyme